jgi:DNA-binding GntR family transcriptional regulator
MLATIGVEGEIEVLDVRHLQADEKIAQHLQIKIGTPVVAIERLRKTGDVPIIYSIDILPENKMPKPYSKEDFEGSLFEFLEEKGKIYIDHSHSTIRTPSKDDMMSKYVFADPDVQWILLEQISCISTGEPYIFSNDYHNGAITTFHLRRFRN